MDRFLCVETFVRVAQAQSFGQAAHQLGITNSVVSQRIKQLEQFVGAPLFHRSSRHVRLSDLGEAFYKECAETVAGFNALTDQMRQASAAPVGKLRIQMLPGFALDHFGALLAQFHHSHPAIQLDIVVTDRVLDPIEEGFDVAFQIFPPLADTLIEKPLFKVRRLFCASPGYLARHAAPTTPYELAQHTQALYAGYPSRNRWVFTGEGEAIELSIAGHVRSTSVHLLRDFALSDGGIVCLPTLVASKHLLSGELVPVLTRYQLSSFALSAVYPVTQRQSLKVRALIDFLSVHFAAAEVPWDVPLIELGWIRA